MKKEKVPQISRVRHQSLGSKKKIVRNLTPDIKKEELYQSTSVGEINTYFNNNQSLSFFKDTSYKPRPRLISYSPTSKTKINSSLIVQYLKKRSISKKGKISNQKIFSKGKVSSIKSKSKSKTKTKKQIPTKKTQSISNLSDVITNETKMINSIKQQIINLVSTSKNPRNVISELEKILKEASIISNTITRVCTEPNSNSTKNSTISNKVLSQLELIHKKCDIMEEENIELKKILVDKTESFEDVKKSINSVQAEIDKIKEKNTKYKKVSTDSKKLPMKNVSINLQLIQKVKGIEDLKVSDTIVNTKPTFTNKVNELNFENLSKTSLISPIML